MNAFLVAAQALTVLGILSLGGAFVAHQRQLRRSAAAAEAEIIARLEQLIVAASALASRGATAVEILPDSMSNVSEPRS